MGNKGSNTTTSQSYANPMAMQAYSDLLARAAGVASTPYTPFTGQEVAPINQQQQAGFGNINNAASLAGNNVTAASNYLTNNLNGITPSDVAQWESPYTQQVIDATQAQFNHDNAVQQSQVTGNAAAQNALGGDRSAVAAALTAEGQQRAQAPVIAGLRDKGYQSAVSTALANRGQGMQAAGQLAGVANQYLPTAQAQVGAGTLEQQTSQAQDTAAFQDYLRQQGYPFQTAQWLAGIQTGVGSNMGGYSTTQGPTPNPWSQIAGLGLSAAMMFANRGGRVERAGGGYVGPYAGAESYVPTAQIHQGHGPPQAPQAQKQAGLGMKDWGQLGAAANKWWNDEDTTPDYSMKIGDYSMPVFDGRTTEAASGGRIGYAGGGAPSLTNGSLPWLDDQMEADKWYAPTTAGFGASRPAADLDFEDRWVDVPKDYTREGAIKRNLLQGAGTVSDSPAVQDRLQAGLLEPPERLPEEREASVSLPRPRPAGLGPQDDGLSAIDTAMGAPEEELGEAMGYAGQPAPRPGVGDPPPPTPPQATAPAAGEPSDIGGILQRLGFKMSPELRQGLLQAGLGMMAGGHGGPGSFLQNLGEGGMYGVQGYNQSLIQQRRDRLEAEKMRRDQAKDELERTKVMLPYERMTKAQEAANALQKDKDKWTFKEGDGLTIPDRAFNGATGEIKDLPPGTVKAMNSMDNGAGSGAYQFAVGAPSFKKGEAVPEPAPVSGHSSAALKSDAELFLANGMLPKASTNPRNPQGKQELNYQRAVKNYAVAVAQSRGLSEQDIADIRQFGPQAARFPLSAQGNQTVALGTAIRHLDSLRQFADAWAASRGSDSPILREAAARFASVWGSDAPTNLQAAARIAAPEIIKAVGVAGAGTGGERVEQEKGFAPNASNEQILGAIKVAQDFLAGQLPAKENQANAIHFPHDKFVKMVGENEYKRLEQLRGHGEAPAKQLSDQDKAALNWANANPNDPRAAAIKKKLGVQ